MQIQEKVRDNSLWIEITDQKGFLMFGDLSLYQRGRGTNLSSNQVDIICENCPHKFRFSKKEIDEGRARVWDWWHWWVFLRGNQLSKSELGGYYAKIRIEFYCKHCQNFLPSR